MDPIAATSSMPASLPASIPVSMPCPPQADQSSRRQHWQCISGCGACCRLDPEERGEAIEALDADQRELYLSMVGSDGWCIHFDTGGRRCRIYDQRPDFCRVENLMTLFGSRDPGEPAPPKPTQTSQLSQGDRRQGGNSPTGTNFVDEADLVGEANFVGEANLVGEANFAGEASALAIACCKQQIRSQYGGRGRVMRRFLRVIRQKP
jgi:hypothetical protein